MNDMTTKRTRSPNFPYAPLSQCVELTRKLHRALKTSPFPIDIAMKRMDLRPDSSVSNRIVSSMLGYGLLDDEGTMKNKTVQVSELGRRIAIDDRPNNPKVLKELQTAALNDPMMKKVWDHWQRGLPRVESDLKTDLEKDFGFQSEAAGRFARVIIDNYKFAQLDEYFDLANNNISTEEHEPIHSIPEIKYSQNKPTPGAVLAFKEYTLSLGAKKEVKLWTSNALTQDDIEFMIQWINRLDLKRESQDDEK